MLLLLLLTANAAACAAAARFLARGCVVLGDYFLA
jgi:hypothetical protein